MVCKIDFISLIEKEEVIDWNVFKNENKDNLTLIFDWISKNLIKSMSIKNFRSIMYSFLHI